MNMVSLHRHNDLTEVAAPHRRKLGRLALILLAIKVSPQFTRLRTRSIAQCELDRLRFPDLPISAANAADLTDYRDRPAVWG